MRKTADIKSVLSAARERLLKDKFFRIATSLFEQTAVDRIEPESSASELTCRQVASRHGKVWRRMCTASQDNFVDDTEMIYDSLNIAITQDDVDKVEVCLTRLRNRLCFYLAQLRKHISWLKSPTASVYEGEWVNIDHNSETMHVVVDGSALIVQTDSKKLYVQAVCRDHFTLAATGNARLGLTTFTIVDKDLLQETRSIGRYSQRWRRHGPVFTDHTVDDSVSSLPPPVPAAALPTSSPPPRSPLGDATNSPRPVLPTKLPALSLEMEDGDGETSHSRLDSAGGAVISSRSRAVLASMALDQGLSPQQYSRVESSVVERSFQLGSIVFAEGSTVGSESCFYIIESGFVAVTRDGRGTEELQAGECFGELALISGRPRPCTVVAKTSIVRLLCLQRSAFWAAAGHDSSSKWAELKHHMQFVHAALETKQEQDVGRCLRASEMDLLSFEAASKDLNVLTAASWRALIVSKQLVKTRQTTGHNGETEIPWRLNLLLARVVKVFQSNRISRVKAEFGMHEQVVTDVQARIRGYLERRRQQYDHVAAVKTASQAATEDIDGIASKELQFWDWPRVRIVMPQALVEYSCSVMIFVTLVCLVWHSFVLTKRCHVGTGALLHVACRCIEVECRRGKCFVIMLPGDTVAERYFHEKDESF